MNSETHHATPSIALGSKLGFDATKRLPDERRKGPIPPFIKVDVRYKGESMNLWADGNGERDRLGRCGWRPANRTSRVPGWFRRDADTCGRDARAPHTDPHRDVLFAKGPAVVLDQAQPRNSPAKVSNASGHL